MLLLCLFVQLSCLSLTLSFVLFCVCRLSGSTAFSSSDGNIYQHILTGSVDYPEKVWSRVDPLALDLVKRFLVVDPEYRIPIAEAMKHPWVHYGLNKLVVLGGPLGAMAASELEEQKKMSSDAMEVDPPEAKKPRPL